MARNKKPRKKYQPRPVLADPVSWLVKGLKPVKESRLSDVLGVQIQLSSALQSTMTGSATRRDMERLTTALNMATILRDNYGICDDLEDCFADASAALKSLVKRGIANGDRFITKANELNAIRLMVNTHHLQLDRCSLATMEKSSATLWERIQRGEIEMLTAEDSQLYLLA